MSPETADAGSDVSMTDANIGQLEDVGGMAIEQDSTEAAFGADVHKIVSFF